MTKILIVDDELIIRDRMQKLLELDDYRVFTAEDGQKGLKVFEQEHPEIALIDIKMPGMDGIELLRRVKEKATETEVIMIAGHGGIDTAIDALKMDAFGYIQKPIDYDELVIEIKRALEKQEMQKKLNGHVHTLEIAHSELDQIFNSAADGMWVIGKDFNVLRTNQAFAALSGVNADEALGKKCYDIFANLLCHTPNCAMLRILDGDKRIEVDIEKERKGGTKHSYSLTIVPFMTPAGEPIGVIENIRDITERQLAARAIKKAHDELEQRVKDRTAELLLSNEELRLQSEIASNMSEGVYLVRVSDNKIIYTNPRFDEMFGHDPDEMIGQDVSIINAPSDMSPQETVDHIVGVLRQTGAWRGEIQHIKKDGTAFWSYASVSVYEHHDHGGVMVSVLTDITERKQAGEMLRESEEKYRILFDQANIAILVAQDGMVKSPNPRALELHGYSEEEFTSKPFIDFIHPEDRKMVQDRHERRLRGEDPPNTYSYRIINRAGDTKWIELNVVAILWEGRPATLCFMTDISNQKQFEKERKALETQLLQAHKMEAIGTLAGGIAHDFNNILSVIMGCTELSLFDIPKEASVHNHLRVTLDACNRARDLVKQILTFSRQSEQERKPLIIGIIIKEALEMLRASLPATIVIKQDIQEDAGVIMADPTQVHQIIMNLSTNAAHAMREKGGVLNVSLTDVKIDDQTAEQNADLKSGSHIKLTVSDTGQGIEPEVMERIFEPYFTTKGVNEGTGLGLSVVHGIIRSYEGAINVRSEAGKGTTFEVLLPKIDLADNQIETSETEEIPTGTEQLLFVDDEPEMVNTYRRMLERLGYTVTARTSSIEALEAFRAQPDRYDLVITDQTMPHMTGQMLAKEMMAIRPDIAIILCTGHSDRLNENRAKEMGVQALVMKPIAMGEIARTIREVLNKQK